MKKCAKCKWLIGDWCDFNHSRVEATKYVCSAFDDSPRMFDHEYFYNLCKKFCEMYDNFKNNRSYMKSNDEIFNHGEVELLSYALNDLQREISFYSNINLYEEFNYKK